MTCKLNRATAERARIVALEETCWGQAGSGTPIGIEFLTVGLSNVINSFQSGLIKGNRMRRPSQQGNHRPGGPITGEAQPNGIWPLLWKHALGGTVSTVGSGPYTHSLQGDIDLPEGLTFEERFGYPDGTYQYIRHYGAVVNEIGLEVPLEGPITMNAAILSKNEDADVTEALHASPNWPDDNQPFNSFHAAMNMALTEGAARESIATLQSIRLSVNNAFDEEQFAIDPSRARADLPPGFRTVSGGFTAFFTPTNYGLYKRYKDHSKLSFELILTRGTKNWHFTLPAIRLTGDPAPKVQGPGGLSLEFQFEAEEDLDEGTDILLAITNDDPTLSTAA